MNSTTSSLPLIEERPATPVARYATHTARILLGLCFFVFGLNGFLYFIPEPSTPMPERAVAFFTGLMNTGYMLPLIAGTQVIVGALLLLNRFVPLALVLIAPVIVHIVAYHLFLEPSGTTVGLVVLGLEAYLLWTKRSAYQGLLAARA
jgi:uncharacterized membrane protein YphA (DoxX/SURF4 family)